jgi:hypothetical protein
MDKLVRLIKELIASQFFGKLEIQFESGKIVMIRKTETIKP